MKKIIKKAILFICLICVFIVPNVNGMERREQTLFLTHGSSDQFYISLDKGEELSWKFETYNNSFLTTLTIYLYSVEFICIEKEKGSYTIDIDETNNYLFGIYNQDEVDGYIHYVIKNIESTKILSYPLFLILGIIGIYSAVRIKKISRKKGLK